MSVLILALLFALVHSYPDGAPRRVCKRLTPGHKDIDYIRSQTGAVIEAEKLSPGRYLVKIKATQPFKGFIVQGRHMEEEPIGVFSPPKSNEYKWMDCFKINGSTITHTNNEAKNEIEAEWNANPSSIGGSTEALEGSYLLAAVVYNYTTVQKLAVDL